MSLVLCLVARSCLTLCDPVDCIPPGSSVLGVFQARMSGLPFSFSRGSSPPRDPTRVSCLSCFAGRFFTCWATGEAPIISLENTNWIDIVLCSEKAMAPHSRTLAWKIPWMEEPGRLQSWGRAWLSDFTFTFNFSCIGEGSGKPLQCSCLKNPRDGEAWWASVYGVTQSRTQLRWLSNSNSFVLLACVTLCFYYTVKLYLRIHFIKLQIIYETKFFLWQAHLYVSHVILTTIQYDTVQYTHFKE